MSKPEIAIATTQFIKNEIFPLQNPPVPKWLIKEFPSGVRFKSTYALRWPCMKIQENINYSLYKEFIDPSACDSDYCDHVVNTVTIRSNGDVVPCCYDLTSKLVMGNISHDSLVDI